LGEKALELAKLSKHPVGLIGGVKLEDSFGDEIKYRVVGSDLYKK
jgi:thiamine-phosphate pyrophosphorylase